MPESSEPSERFIAVKISMLTALMVMMVMMIMVMMMMKMMMSLSIPLTNKPQITLQILLLTNDLLEKKLNRFVLIMTRVPRVQQYKKPVPKKTG